MNIYTAHLHPRRNPVLVREAFAWGALFFGPLWLARHGAWIAASLALAALLLACTAAPPPLRPLLAFGVFLFLAVLGNDIRRWSLGLGQFQLVHVIAARSREEALYRLLANRLDLRRQIA